MFDFTTESLTLACLIALAIGLGFLLGVMRTRKYYAKAFQTITEQLFYWRYRYFQTLQDYQDLAEEKRWIRDWCPDSDDNAL